VALLRDDISEDSIASMLRIVTANIVPRSPIVTITMEVIHSSETLVLTRATGRYISEGHWEDQDIGGQITLRQALYG
jgi:hypothetical protein